MTNSPNVTALSEALCEQAITRHRAHDQIINERDQVSHHMRSTLVGEIMGLQTALCLLHGWNINTDADKEGPADKLILNHWRTHYPKEWPQLSDSEQWHELRAEVVESHPELDTILRSPEQGSGSVKTAGRSREDD